MPVTESFCRNNALPKCALLQLCQITGTEQIVTSNLSKAHETRDSLAVPDGTLSCSISIYFVAIHS